MKLDDMLRMDLQLFADDGLIGDGSENDDPTEEDASVEDEGDGELEELSALLTDDDEQEEDAEDTEQEEEPEQPEGPPSEPAGKFYTQQELDALIGSRVQREQAKYANLDLNSIKQLEKAAGMPVNDILEHVKGNRVQSLVDNGVDEDIARKQVEQDLHFEELQERVQRSEGYIQNMTRSVNYERQKNAIINSNPYYKKYEAEIDAFAANGENLDFENAAIYILGKKFAEGELREDIVKGTENKLLASSKRRSKTPESGSVPGGKAKGQLTSYERSAAQAFGISEKEWLKSKQQLEKRKRR